MTLAVNVIIIWVLDSEETKVFGCYRILAENVIDLKETKGFGCKRY